MLSKRLTCFYLLLQNITLNEIADLIKISTSTALYLKQRLNQTKVIKHFLIKRSYQQKIANLIIDIIDELSKRSKTVASTVYIQEKSYKTKDPF